MLNDPMVLESARVLAQRLSLEKTTGDEKIEKAFRLILCRTPKDRELKILRQYYAGEKETFVAIPKKAVNLLAVGETPQAKLADKPAAAALMQTIMMLYNLEETIML
ncbi:hypothetical protein BLX24_30450 [Arsenicibacter rosenii]|uniref:DUF1553 domain-containing protein n=2 Tax=Arsenicibacter rosenii TaxID=1750698 RepID=A0A1S2VB49_9BACT|nr:hypothetical protein BLX24_30450 [Arsenicibacter rosenii]